MKTENISEIKELSPQIIIKNKTIVPLTKKENKAVDNFWFFGLALIIILFTFFYILHHKNIKEEFPFINYKKKKPKTPLLKKNKVKSILVKNKEKERTDTFNLFGLGEVKKKESYVKDLDKISKLHQLFDRKKHKKDVFQEIQETADKLEQKEEDIFTKLKKISESKR